MVSDQNKIISAFTIGYFTSYLRDYLDDKNATMDDFKKSFLIEHSCEINDTLSGLYEDVFEKKCDTTFQQSCIDEMKDSINYVINSTSDEISKREDSSLEMAFLSGSFLSVADAALLDEFDRSKFELICGELIHSLNLNIAWQELEKLMIGLSSGSPNKKCNSRDELFLMISSNSPAAKKIYGFQYLMDRLSLQRAFAHLTDVGMYLSSFMLLFSMGY